MEKNSMDNDELNNMDIDDILNKMKDNPLIGMDFVETIKQSTDKLIREHRQDLIRFLKADRENLLMNMQQKIGSGKTLNREYQKSIKLALDISELIKLMTEEHLRDEGA